MKSQSTRWFTFLGTYSYRHFHLWININLQKYVFNKKEDWCICFMMFLGEWSPEISFNDICRAHSRQTRVIGKAWLCFSIQDQSIPAAAKGTAWSCYDWTDSRKGSSNFPTQWMVMETLPLHLHLSPCSNADPPYSRKKMLMFFLRKQHFNWGNIRKHATEWKKIFPIYIDSINGSHRVWICILKIIKKNVGNPTEKQTNDLNTHEQYRML